MKVLKVPTVLIVLLVLVAATAAAQDVGPKRGSLVAVGGGSRLGEAGIWRRFIDLAGGNEATIVVIPTAGEEETYDQFWSGLRGLRDAGAKHVTVQHTKDRKVADSETFVKAIREAAGVWLSGGRHWRLADSYLNTRTHKELAALLDRGGVIGGTSAGATIQGSFMIRGDTKGNTLMVGDHVDGFGFLKGVTIDQHVLRRNRQFDLVDVIRARPELLGIGIDENTGIVVHGDSFEVIGDSYVLIYDHTRRLDSGGEFYFLAPGDQYNLKTREAERPTERTVPIERVVKQPWKK
ncbi:MAG TPA: cyanophycinase [Vicinamibacterales bacterium]|jgi:cyanophycinase|nr:cyanophycinase [Vicinamibacterales bacterium]